MLTDALPVFVFVIFIGGIFSVSWAGTWGLIKIAYRHSLLDIPNQRSSHSVPTPRGGGLALLFAFFLGGGCLAVTGRIDIPHALGLSGCGLGIVLAGFWDDLYELSAVSRLIVHFCCVFLAVFFFIPGDALPFFGSHGIASFFSLFFVVSGVVWLLNLFNFMDGIDGLAGAETISVALGGGIILFFTGDTNGYLPLLLVLAASTSGFLIWNWYPAKIFMGDACSAFLGFCFGILALLTSLSSGLNIWAWMILLAAFVVDATVTLGVRIRRGEKIYEAHRSHAYQILARRVGSHMRVTLFYTGINWLLLFPLACLSVYKPQYGFSLVLFSYFLLTVFFMVAGAGTTND